jgi:hypothetical protein
MKRRIEITRDRRTRVQLVQQIPSECPQCRRPLALAPVDVVTARELTAAQLEAAVQGKALAAWNVSPGFAMVCAGCVRDLLKTTGS